MASSFQREIAHWWKCARVDEPCLSLSNVNGVHVQKKTRPIHWNRHLRLISSEDRLPMIHRMAKYLERRTTCS